MVVRNALFISSVVVTYENAVFSPFCLAPGKADNAPSPVLSRVPGNDYSFTLGDVDLGHP